MLQWLSNQPRSAGRFSVSVENGVGGIHAGSEVTTPDLVSEKVILPGQNAVDFREVGC